MAEVREVVAPVENVNDESIAILRWLVDDESFVEEGTSLLLAETTKATVDVAAPGAGFVCHVAQAGSDVPIGSVLCYIAESVEAARNAAAQAATVPRNHAVLPAPTFAAAEVRVSVMSADVANGVRDRREVLPVLPIPRTMRLSARAKSLVAQLGLDPAVFTGRGVVRERDVRAHGQPAPPAASAKANGSAAVSRPGSQPDTVTLAQDVPVRSELLARSKRYEGRRLRAALANTVQSSVTVSVPVAGFLSPASPRAARLPEGTPGAVIIAETARLLRVYPQFNAVCQGETLHYYHQVNVGYAIDLGHGLRVPVFRDADRKTVNELADEKQKLIVEYLNETLSLQALTGGTFTITDLSGEAVEYFQPVLNDGQSGILGVCAASAAGGAFNLVLGFDHQVAEGRTAAAFLRDLRDRIVAHDASLQRRSDTFEAAEPRCGLCLRPASELEADRQFLLRAVPRPGSDIETVCTICMQDWS